MGEFGVVELENNGNSGKVIVWFEFVGLLLEEERNSGFSEMDVVFYHNNFFWWLVVIRYK